MPAHNLIAIDEAAKLLGVSPKTLRLWEAQGKIKSIRTIGRHRRYNKNEIQDFRKQKNTKKETPLTIEKASEHLGVSKKTLRLWETQGKVRPTRTPGGHRRFILADLEKTKVSPFVSKVKVPEVKPINIIDNKLGQTADALPQLYASLHKDQKAVLFGIGSILVIALGILLGVEFMGKQKLNVSYKKLSPQVLQAESEGSLVTFNINVEQITKEDALFEKDVTILGTLNGVDLTVSNDAAIEGSLTLGGQLVVPATLEVSGETTLADTLTLSGGNLILGDGGVINIGGSGSDVDYNVIGDSTSGASSSVNSDDDLYIEGNLEVDGTITGSLSGSFSGTFNPSLTTGSVFFQGSSGLAGDATNFFWDDTNNRLGIGTSSPSSTLTVSGGNITIGSGNSILPSVNIGSDLGSSSLKFNNLYVANINSDSALTLSGQGIFTYNPADTTYAEASVRINPTAPSTNEQMLGIGQGGEERAAIDAEGDLTIGYDGAAGSSVPTSSNPLNIYGHGTTQVLAVDTSGTIIGGTTNSVRLQAGGTTSGNGNNSSIYFLDSAGTTKGRFDTVSTPLGTGQDGAITISSSINCQTADISTTDDDSTADCIATAITAAANAGNTLLTVTSTTGYSAGDEVLVIQVTGTGAGNYETRRVQGVPSATSLELSSYLANTYQSSGAQVVRVPNYSSVTVSSAGTLTVSAWNGTTGGVLYIRASGTVTIDSGGIVDGNSLGGVGGTAGTAGTAGTGSVPCTGGAGTGASGGGGGNGGAATAGTGGGGGGAGGSGGGGGGGALAYNGSAAGGASGGGGGGGGHSAAGTAGTAGANGGSGNGGSPSGGGAGTAGAAVGDASFSSLHVGGGGGAGSGGGGGGGGGCLEGGNAQGGAGGAGAAGAAGGRGGGIIVISGSTITNSGTIRANGANGSNASGNGSGGSNGNAPTFPGCGSGGGGGAHGGAGGGGAGGAVWLIGSSVTAGTVTVTAGSGGTTGSLVGGNAGAAVNNGPTCAGSGGGARSGTGASGNGAASPSGDAGAGSSGRTLTSTLPISTYGTLHAGAVNTTAADVAEVYGAKEVLKAGEVVSLDPENKVYVKNSSQSYDPRVLGIVSTEPGMVLGRVDTSDPNMNVDYNFPIALTGRVPVKIASTSAEIKIGDPLTSSDIAGRAMKATKLGPVIGKALEEWRPEENKDSILVFVQGGYYLGAVDEAGFIQTESNLAVNDLKINLDAKWNQETTSTEAAVPASLPLSLSQIISEIFEKLKTLEVDITLLKSQQLLATTSNGILQDNAKVTTDVDSFGDVVIAGKLDVGSLNFDGLENSVDAIGTLKIQPLALGNIELLGGLIKIDKEGHLIGNDEIRGSEILPAGEIKIEVVKNWQTPPKSIVVSPSYVTAAGVTRVDQNGFTIEVKEASDKEEEVFWSAIW